MKFLILLALTGLAVAAVHKIPLMKIESAMMRMLKAGTWADHIKEMEIIRATAHKEGGVYHDSLLDYLDLEYIVTITIGTPGQEFSVVPDTGSSDLWVFESSTVGKTHKFNKNASTTYQPDGRPISLQYEQGTVSGFFGKDTVRLGASDTTQLIVPEVIFVQVETADKFFRIRYFEGILGLAFASGAKGGAIPPFIKAGNQGLLDQQLFTVYFERHGFTRGSHGGVITYGGIDTANCEDVIAYEKLTHPRKFRFTLKSVAIGTYSASKTWAAISDTGASIIMGPHSNIEKIAEIAGATYNFKTNGYNIDCALTPPNFKIEIGSHIYEITSRNFIVPIENNKCLFAFLGYNGGGFLPSWILGQPVIREYCHIYDIGNQRIGFALSKQEPAP